MKFHLTTLLSLGILLPACGEQKVFETSFESVEEFDGFYITPVPHKDTTYQELSTEQVLSGQSSHKAWIEGANAPADGFTDNNHRGYPTIQFQNSDLGVFKTPVYVTLNVWLDMELTESINGGVDDWFSFATFTDDESDNWGRTVLVNLSHDGFVHLGHVPYQDNQTHIYQNTELTFPQKQWVEIKMYLDFSSDGYAKVWQDGELVSHAQVENIDNKLSQIHFGMYAPPQMTSGIVYNDDVRIEEVDGE